MKKKHSRFTRKNLIKRIERGWNITLMILLVLGNLIKRIESGYAIAFSVIITI